MKYIILIIDDDIQIGNLEQEVLEREGYICYRALHLLTICRTI